MSFKEAYEDYLLFASKRQKKQSFESLLQRFNKHILPYFKDIDIFDLNCSDIIQWQFSILNHNFSNNYNSNLHSLLSRFLNYCCIYLNLDKNVASQVGTFKKHYEIDKHDFYTLKEFKRFIKFVNHPVYKQFFNFLFFTGARPGEAMALKFSDLQGKFISINKTIESHGDRSLGTPKTFSSNRLIRIDNRLYKDLLKLRKYYVGAHNEVGNDYFIFGGFKPLAPTTINRYKIKACKMANLRPITLHQFRHSHATLLLSKGVLINEISRRLGHSQVSTTLDVYTHTDLSQEKKCISTLNFIRFNFFESLLQHFKKLYQLLQHF